MYANVGLFDRQEAQYIYLFDNTIKIILEFIVARQLVKDKNFN